MTVTDFPRMPRKLAGAPWDQTDCRAAIEEAQARIVELEAKLRWAQSMLNDLWSDHHGEPASLTLVQKMHGTGG